MKIRHGVIFMILIFYCPFDSVDNFTVVDNFEDLENETIIEGIPNIENLINIDDLTCIVNITSVNNVTCSYKTYKTSELNDFGLDLLNDLPEEFPVSFQSHADVNMTQEKEYLLEVIEENNLAEIYHDMEESNITTAYENSEEVLTIEILAQFSKYIEKSGKRGLKSLAYKVKNLVNPTLYLNHILKVPKYLTELDKYNNFILQKKIRCEIDLQFIILDVLESSIKIFGKASEEVCGVIVQESNITLSFSQIDAIEEAIGLAVFNEKKLAFNYICKETYICRYFPAYSDYVAKLLKSVLKLQEKYFMVIVNIIEDTLRAKAKFLKNIIDKKTAHNITLKLESIADNPVEVSSLITIVINYIMQRFKVFYVGGAEIRNSTKSVRILIDIIDVTFQVTDENIMGSDFRDLTQHINEWARGKNRDLELILTDFLYDAIDLMDIYWNREIKEEVKVLIQSITRGTTDNDTLLDQLFTRGSKIASSEHVIYAENEEFNLV